MDESMKSDFYVYIHRLGSDLGLPFYVGKGRGRRINSKKDRNKYWHHVVNAYGYTVEYVAEGLTEAEAFALEIEFIRTFKTLELPHFCNLTDGGEGASGCVRSEETKKRQSEALKGEKSSMFGKPSHNRGKTSSEETRKKISEALKGKPAHNRRTVIGKNLVTGEEYIFESCTAAATFVGVGHPSVSDVCRGELKKTKGWSFKYVEK